MARDSQRLLNDNAEDGLDLWRRNRGHWPREGGTGMGGRHALCVVSAIVSVALSLGACGRRSDAPSAVSPDARPPSSAVAGGQASAEGVRGPDAAEAEDLEAAPSGQPTGSSEERSEGDPGPPNARIMPSPPKPRDKAAPHEERTSTKPMAPERATTDAAGTAATAADGTTGAAADGQGIASANAAEAKPRDACKGVCGPSGCAPTGNGLPGWGALKDGTGGLLSR